MAVRRGVCNSISGGHGQRAWDDPCCQRLSSLLLSSAVDDTERARLRASLTASSGAWLQAFPILSVGLRMDDDVVIRLAVGLRLGANLCEPHTVSLWMPVARTGWPGSEVQDSPPPRPAQRRRVACDAASPGAVLKGAGLSRSDGKRPDGVSLIPWSRGRCVTWDVKSPRHPRPISSPLIIGDPGWGSGCSSRSCQESEV